MLIPFINEAALVFGRYHFAIDYFCPAVFEAMVIGDQKTFAGIFLYYFMRIDVPAFYFTKYNIANVIV